MRILTHDGHCTYDAELAKTGHEFFSLGAPTDWDLRKAPPNWHFIGSPDGIQFDCILLNNSWRGFPLVKDVKAPLIFGIIADCSEGTFPLEIEERSSAVVFLAREVAQRWTMKDPSKKVVIEMGMDESPFLAHVGDSHTILTVGQRIAKRWDKGHCPYVTVSNFMPLTLVGPGNEGLPGAAGEVPPAKLIELYSHARVYFNPGPIIGISVAEAMMAGLPIVAFRPINLRDLIVDGVNGFVVDTVDGAVIKLHRLLDDPDLALRMGREAKATARAVFGLPRFVDRWNSLLGRVTSKDCGASADLG